MLEETPALRHIEKACLVEKKLSEKSNLNKGGNNG